MFTQQLKVSKTVLLHAQCTTNGMCIRNSTYMYVAQIHSNKVSTGYNLYFCLRPQCEALHTCCLGPSIAISEQNLSVT